MTPHSVATAPSAVHLHRTAKHHAEHGDVFKTLFDLSGLCMASLDRSFRVKEANAGFFEQFGRSADDACGRSFQDFLHPGIQGRVQRQFDGLADGHRSRFVSPIVGVRPSDAVFSAELSVGAVHRDHGRIDSAVALVTNEKEEAEGQAATPGRTRLSVLDARILEGVAAGISTVDMATKLYLSRQGVEYHVSSMLRRLRAPNRAALVSRAYSLGVLSVGSWPPKVLPDCVR
jgi:PAS domain S-box-containing protein